MQYSFSYWEKSVWFEEIDVTIIGSGIVGLSAALHIKKLEPEANILVLERGLLPSGASSKNAGFAVFGSPSELLMDLKTHSPDEVFGLVAKRLAGLNLLRENLSDQGISYEEGPGHELFLEQEKDAYQNCMDNLTYLNRSIEERTGLKNVYLPADNKIANFGFKGVKHMVANTGEATINTGIMLDTLIRKAQMKGIRILNNIHVHSFSDLGDHVQIQTDLPFHLNTKQMLIATNAFASELIPDIDVIPGRGQVLVTSAIKDLNFHGPCHFDQGYFYFRRVGDRVLLGGGRNLDFDSERTTTFGLTELVQNKLEYFLKEMILPGKSFDIDYRWSGIMGFGERKTVIVRKISDNVTCAVRLGGIGIAIGSLIGQEAAEMLSNKKT